MSRGAILNLEEELRWADAQLRDENISEFEKNHIMYYRMRIQMLLQKTSDKPRGKIVKASSLTKSRGLDASVIKRYCHRKDSPFFQERPGGTWRVDEGKLDVFLEKLAAEKE